MKDLAVESSVLLQTPKHSTYNLGYQTLTTTRFGQITPTFLMEAVPGDRVSLGHETLVRFQPLVSPVMHRMELVTHYFFVPYRILWSNWTEFITRQKNKFTNLDPVQPFVPYAQEFFSFDSRGYLQPKLMQYFGLHGTNNPLDPLPINGSEKFRYNIYANAAYQMIYNFYYRHKLVTKESEFELKDGRVDEDFFVILNQMRNITYKPDYFNSALPTPQAGEPAFIDDDAPIFRSGVTNTLQGTLANQPIPGVASIDPDVSENSLYARFRVTTEEIRRAVALQRYLEANLHGTTHDDFIKVHFGTDVGDARLSQPEYISGSRQPIVVSDVMNQSDNYQGRISGNAAGYGSSRMGSFTAPEHGLFIGLSSVVYDPAYVHAQPKMFMKTGSPFEYLTPEFDGIGEQPILKNEAYGGHQDGNEVFGYVPRYHEYRTSYDKVTGEMKKDFAHWHLARSFGPQVVLSSDFFDVADDRRIFSVQSRIDDPIILQVQNKCVATRPLSRNAERII